ncbi:MAG TPA: hypothetical protein VFL27_03610 [Candidatus Dormibacteraeota bacterium]|nr:hypothetical protein [Candidatus Dormibacteraeota bacterium]
MRGWYAEPLLMYDVTDPVHPRLLCTISNTSAHLFTADTFQYLKPVSTTETDVMLRSLGSGNESVAARLPFAATSIAWLTDLSVAAYMVAGPAGFQVWLYSQQKSSLVFTFQEPGVGCICRFGLPGQTLAISPDGQYLLAGPGVGTPPLAVYRVSDRARVATLSTSPAFWDRTGHRLFVAGGSAAAQTWTPEGGFAALRSAAQWPYFPGESPDGSQVVYTAYSDTGAEAQPRVYSYDVKAASTRMLIDRMRTQVVFVKDGWAWYLEEATCDPATCNVPFSTMPTGNVFAMQLSTGTEAPVVFAAGENPVLRTGSLDAASFGSAEYWPNT